MQWFRWVFPLPNIFNVWNCYLHYLRQIIYLFSTTIKTACAYHLSKSCTKRPCYIVSLSFMANLLLLFVVPFHSSKMFIESCSLHCVCIYYMWITWNNKCRLTFELPRRRWWDATGAALLSVTAVRSLVDFRQQRDITLSEHVRSSVECDVCKA